ncbi:MAG: response regulator [Chloroflexi bacterium]|nr:response regulator [Chloroflexota bacterium]
MEGEALVILLVEDNLDHAELIIRSFQNHRVVNQIYHVTDGEAALNYLFRRNQYADPEKSPEPHVILLDLRLPRIDGLQVLKEIKADDELRCIPIVVLTTSEAESDLAQAYEHHANSYLVKPVDFSKFTQLMDDMGFYWLGWNRHPCL